jgi:hypothetical protein
VWGCVMAFLVLEPHNALGLPGCCWSNSRRLSLVASPVALGETGGGGGGGVVGFRGAGGSVVG